MQAILPRKLSCLIEISERYSAFFFDMDGVLVSPLFPISPFYITPNLVERPRNDTTCPRIPAIP